MNTSSYNYSLENQQGITKLISKLYALVINPEKYPYLLHQKNHYNNVPLWATTKALTLGTVSKMYSFLPQHIQTAISKEFPFVNKTMLEKMLDILTLTRNVCAHNERLFDHIFMKSSIYDTAVHANLKIPKRKSLYRKGKKDLFAVVITFKYLLEKEDFDTFCDELEGLIETLKKQTNQIQQAQVYKDMGFPDNWKDIRNM